MGVHVGDPESSHEALALMESTGARERHYDVVLRYLAWQPGRTASELATMTGLSDVEVRRRLSDAKENGVAYRQGARRAEGRKVSESCWWLVLQQGALPL